MQNPLDDLLSSGPRLLAGGMPPAPSPSSDWKIDPAIQAQRDASAEKLVRAELDADPHNTALQNELKLRFGNTRKVSANASTNAPPIRFSKDDASSGIAENAKDIFSSGPRLLDDEQSINLRHGMGLNTPTLAHLKTAQAPAMQPSRTMGEAVGDTAKQLGKGVNTILGAIPNLSSPDGELAKFFNDNASAWDAAQSAAYKQRRDGAQQRILDAGRRGGTIDEIWTAASEYLGDPALTAGIITETLPSMIPGIGAVKGIQLAALARGATAARAAQLGIAGGGVTNAALNAGGARQGAYQTLTALPEHAWANDPEYIALRNRNMTHAQAASERAKSLSLLPAAVGGIVGYLTGRTGLESALVGKGSATAVRRAGVEMFGEQAEEVTPQLATNMQAQRIDANHSLSEGLGATIVQTAIGGAPGTAAAVMAGTDNPLPTTGIQAPEAAAPNQQQPLSAMAQRTRALTEFLADKPQARVLREADPEGYSEFLRAYRIALNPQMDSVVRNRALDDIDAYLQRHGFTAGMAAIKPMPESAPANIVPYDANQGTLRRGDPQGRMVADAEGNVHPAFIDEVAQPDPNVIDSEVVRSSETLTPREPLQADMHGNVGEAASFEQMREQTARTKAYRQAVTGEVANQPRALPSPIMSDDQAASLKRPAKLAQEVRAYQARLGNERTIVHEAAHLPPPSVKENDKEGGETHLDHLPTALVQPLSEGPSKAARETATDSTPPTINHASDNDTAVELVTHVTGRGKTIRGVIRKDLTLQKAKEIDAYTFRKDGGFFIREKHLADLPAAEQGENATRELGTPQSATPKSSTPTPTRPAVPHEDSAEREAARRKVKADKLRTAGQKLIEQADAQLGRERNTNTVRRATMAGHALADAYALEATGNTMANLADAVEAGDAKYLHGVSTRIAVEMLASITTQAVLDQDRGLRYKEQLERRGRAFNEKTDAQHIRFPRIEFSVAGSRSRLLEAMKGKRGSASLQEKIRYAESMSQEVFSSIEKLLGTDEMKRVMGWYAVAQNDKIKRLIRMGIEDATQLRAAIIEFNQFRAGARKIDPIKQAEMAIVGQKVGIDFFPTPKALAARMAELAGIEPGMRVLEPSAGNGNLADAAKEAGATVDVIEISSQLRDILSAKGYKIVAHEFENYDAAALYDAIIMNPPFSNRKDGEHIQRAYSMLKPGGKLVAIAGEGVFFGSDKKAVAFREWLDELGADVERLPENTFTGSDLLAQTSANARLIAIDKPRVKASAVNLHSAHAEPAPREAQPEETEERGVPAPEPEPTVETTTEPKAESEAEPKPPSNPAKRKPAPSKIEDFGDRLEGAKKFMRERQLEALSDEQIDIATEPLSKVFPVPNYARLAEEGVAQEALAFVALARNEIPAKPKRVWSLARWVDRVRLLRMFAAKVLSAEYTLERIQDKAQGAEFASVRDLLTTAEALVGVKPDLLPKAAQWKVRSRSGLSFYRNLDLTRGDTVYWLENAEGRQTDVFGTDRADVVSRAKKVIAAEVGAASAAQPEKRYTALAIYQDRFTKEYFIGFKGASSVVRVKSGFAKWNDAVEYKATHRDALQAKIDEMRQGPQERRPGNQPRKGPPRREGDVTAEQFSEMFGFRGVQFGNYVEGARRQAELNEAYDALMDLADVLKVPPKALSLNGELGLAFGARGSGKAKAHYEPGNVVINITKTQGAGSLAHEWMHAVDGYFYRQESIRGKSGNPSGKSIGHITDRGERDDSALRPELMRAWLDVMKAIKSSKGQFFERAKEYDEPRSNPYWSTNHELAARAFERYILDRIAEQGGENDYLVNLYKEGGAYPTDTEMVEQGIRLAFDHLFNTIQTRETDKGVAMYARSGKEIAQELFAAQAPRSTVADIAAELIVEIGKTKTGRINIVQSITDLPAYLRAGVSEKKALDLQGLFEPSDRSIYLIADNIPKGYAMSVLMHEAGVHLGLRELIGNDAMNTLAAQIKLWAAVEKDSTHGKLATLAIESIPENTTEAQRDEELIAYFVMEAVKAGHGEARRGPIATWFAKLWAAVKAAIAKLGADPSTLTVDDVVALARGALERALGEASAYAFVKHADGTLSGDGLTLTRSYRKGGMVGYRVTEDNRPIGYVVLNDDESALHNIDLIDTLQRKGYGERVVRGLLAMKPDALHIADIQQRAYPFWERMGTQLFDLSDQPDTMQDTLQWDDYANQRIKGTADSGKLRRAHEGSSGQGRSEAEIDADRWVRDWLEDELEDPRPDPFYARAREESAEEVEHADKAERINEILRDDQPAKLFRYLKLDELASNIRQSFRDITKTARTFTALNRTLNTQDHKAQKDPKHFGKAFKVAEKFLDDVTAFATHAAEKAPGLLPRYDKIKDVVKPLTGFFTEKRDAAAVSAAVFNGTLEYTIFSDTELTSRFKLNADQRELYRQFLAATNQSLEDLTSSELAREARMLGLNAGRPLQFSGMHDALRYYALQIEDQFEAAREAKDVEGMQRWTDALESFTNKVSHIEKMKSDGYAPLMRFGKFTVDVVDSETGEREGFFMYESESEANAAARLLKEEYGDAAVTQGILSEESYKAFQGVTPETLQVFAAATGMEQTEAFQHYLKLATNNRSALKRLIKRAKVPGYSDDISRVLASFITSNARLTAKNWHMGEMLKAVTDIPKDKGDVKDEAVKLMEYITNPALEAPALRNWLFVHYIGGSFAAAAVNLTQTFTTTIPYLAAKGERVAAIKAIKDAMGMARKLVFDDQWRADKPELDVALKRARDEGVIDPQEIHQLYSEASSRSRGLRALGVVWGSMFSVGERFNRAVAFIAAYQLANQRGVHGAAAYAAAAKVVRETQFTYSKANRPNWARGAVGATLFTFKQFSISYMEMLSRLPNDQKALALGVLIVLAGAGGVPFADDLDDLIDTLGQTLGYDTNAKAWKQQHLNDLIGAEVTRYVLYGVSAGLPLDFSSRLGMGNLLPATGTFKRSNPDKLREASELLGVAGSFAFRNVVEAQSRITEGDVAGAVKVMMPKAIQDALQAVEMLTLGMYRDQRGRKVEDTDAIDAFVKAFGFMPSHISQLQKSAQIANQSMSLVRIAEADLAERMARAIFENDAIDMQETAADLLAWNTQNPDSPISITQSQITRRVKQMAMSKADRILKANSKEMQQRAVNLLVN